MTPQSVTVGSVIGRWLHPRSGPSFWTNAGYPPDCILLGFARGMPGIRTILDVLRVAALWLLIVSVTVGPVVPSVFASAAKTCGVSCPCDEAHDDHAGGHDDHAEADPCDDDAAPDSDHDDGDPCKGECPDDCPNCGCCLGIAMAVLPLPVTSSGATCTSARMHTPIDAPPSGAASGVFRPPRSLI